MENVLLVSPEQKSVVFLNEMLACAFSGAKIMHVHTATQARRILGERDFDLTIINAPLADETGEGLARDAAAGGQAQIILMVRSEIYDEVSCITQNDGILVVGKPLDKGLFWSVLKLAQSTQNKLKKARAQPSNFKQKLKDIRIIDRAKWVLISTLKLSEQEAHRYIEKHAMDIRSTRREVAEGILRTYKD